MGTKTIKQWLETLPEPYRTEALENMVPDRANSIYNTVDEALLAAFKWGYTKQGVEYWSKLLSEIDEIKEQSIKQLQDRITLIEAKHGVTLNAPPETQQDYQKLKKELENKIHRL